MSTPTSINYQKAGELPPIVSLEANDTAVGVRDGSFVQIPKSLFGTDPATYLLWDVASAIGPVGFHFSDPVQSFGVPAIFDNAAKTVTIPLAPDGFNGVFFNINDALPSTGKHWFSVKVDSNSVDLWLGLEFRKKSLPTQVVTRSFLYGTTFETSTSSTINSHVLTQTELSVLVLLDADVRTITFAAEAYSRTHTVATQEEWDDLFLRMDFENYLLTVGLLFSFNLTDPLLAPADVPVDHIPLSMIGTALPTEASEGNFIQATSDGSFNGRDIKAGESAVLIGGQLRRVFDDLKTPNVDKVNTFMSGQRIGSTSFSGDGGIYIGPIGSVLETQIVNVSATLNKVVSLGGAFSNLTNGSGAYAIGLGSNVFPTLVNANYNIGIGGSICTLTNFAEHTVAVGSGIANSFGNIFSSVLIGREVGEGRSGWNVRNAVLIGESALGKVNATDDDPLWTGDFTTSPLTQLDGIVALGLRAVRGGPVGNHLIAIGTDAGGGSGRTSGGLGNIAIGWTALFDGAYNAVGDIKPENAVAIGTGALFGTSGALRSVSVGLGTGRFVRGYDNIAIGALALRNTTLSDVTCCTAVGANALINPGSIASTLHNCTAIGHLATVTGDNQVQLGDSATTVYTYGAVQSRSDERDKYEIRDTLLGLDFINSLRPVDHRWDLREDYIDHASRPVEPDPVREKPSPPSVEETDPSYQALFEIFELDLAEWTIETDTRAGLFAQWMSDMQTWLEVNSISNIVTDGTHARSRFHHGFIAGEVKEAADLAGVDFGGFQDHSMNGGKDVKSLGYEEFIAPIVRSIQELHETMHSDAFVDRLAARVLLKIQEQESES